MRTIRFAVKCAVLSLLLSGLGALTAVAQLTDTGSIVGTVHDQTGAAIPDAKVTATETSTNVQQATRTSGDGGYVLPSLKVGTYSVTIEKPGFQTFVHSGIIVDVQSRLKVDATMQVGSTRQMVEVTAT